MKNITAIISIIFGVGALMVMSSGAFTAVGQSRQSGSSWQLQTSAAFAPAAWKINTETGIAYYCVAQSRACLQMVDQ